MPANHQKYDILVRVYNNMQEVYRITNGINSYMWYTMVYSAEIEVDKLYNTIYDKFNNDLSQAVYKLTEYSNTISSNNNFAFNAGNNPFGYPSNSGFRALYSTAARDYRVAVKNLINALAGLLVNGTLPPTVTKSLINDTVKPHLVALTTAAIELRRLSRLLYYRLINSDNDFNF